MGEGGCRVFRTTPSGEFGRKEGDLGRGLPLTGAEPSGGCLVSAWSLFSVWDAAGARGRAAARVLGLTWMPGQTAGWQGIPHPTQGPYSREDRGGETGLSPPRGPSGRGQGCLQGGDHEKGTPTLKNTHPRVFTGDLKGGLVLNCRDSLRQGGAWRQALEAMMSEALHAPRPLGS